MRLKTGPALLGVANAVSLLSLLPNVSSAAIDCRGILSLEKKIVSTEITGSSLPYLAESLSAETAAQIVRTWQGDRLPPLVDQYLDSNNIASVGSNIAQGGKSSFGVFRALSEDGSKVVIKIVNFLNQVDRTIYIQKVLSDMGLAVRMRGLLTGEALVRLNEKFPIRPVSRYIGLTGMVFDSLEGGWDVKEAAPPPFVSALNFSLIEAKLKNIGTVLEKLAISPFSDIQVMIMPDHRVVLFDLDNFRISNPAENEKYGVSLAGKIEDIIAVVRRAILPEQTSR